MKENTYVRRKLHHRSAAHRCLCRVNDAGAGMITKSCDSERTFRHLQEKVVIGLLEKAITSKNSISAAHLAAETVEAISHIGWPDVAQRTDNLTSTKPRIRVAARSI